MLALLLLAACHPGLPESFGLQAEGLSVEIQTAPYTLIVYDAGGDPMLRSLGAGDGEGYSTLGFTSGELRWDEESGPGYLAPEPDLDPWEDDWVVVDAVEEEASLELHLAPAGSVDERGHVAEDEARRVRVVHTLRPGALRVEASLEGATELPRAWGSAFESPAEEGFLGLGERFTRTQFRGLDMYSWLEEGGIGQGEDEPSSPSNPWPHGEAMSYYPVPFTVSTEGYGFWLDSTWYNELNLATDREDAWRAWAAGPTLAWEVYLPGPNDERPWTYQVIDRFTEATGRPMVPPPWTYGPRRRIGSSDVQQVEGVSLPEIAAMRALDLALTGADDATHFLPRGSHVGREDALAAWTEAARALGARVNGYYNCYFDSSEENVLYDLIEQGLEEGYFLVDAAGEPSEVWFSSGGISWMLTVDMTQAAARAWYTEFFQWALDLGYSGWMYDFGEYVAPDVLTPGGLTGEELHNLFPVLYQQAAHDHLEGGPYFGDWLTFARSGYTGASQYSPLVWTGDPAASFEDADGLPSVVRAGINLGIAGVPNTGSDIDGYHCVADGFAATDEELLVRWIQQGALTPNMQDQDACAFATDEGRKANIFDDPLAQEAWRTYARLHTRLFPYLYTLGVEAHATGAPLMRHAFLEHPEDLALADVDDAYYLGPALYVAPVLERGATTKITRLPPGRFLDLDAQTEIIGGAEVTIEAPLEKLPLLLVDGGLVPLLDPGIDTLSEEDDEDIVGPDDVAEVYDVWGFLTPDTGVARMELWDGSILDVTWDGTTAGLADCLGASLDVAADEEELSTCGACFLLEEPTAGLTRARISMPSSGALACAGLGLDWLGERRLRWDLWLGE
jgi:alpha-glucosidase (family GH31 glycosyl hydrolase)